MSRRTKVYVNLAVALALCFATALRAEPTELARLRAQVQELSAQVQELIAKGAYDSAMPLAQRAMALSEARFGAEHPETATALNDLAVLYFRKGSYARGEALQRRALRIREKTLGPNHLATATSLSNLGQLCDAQGDYAQAERLQRRSLEIRERLLGSEHPDVGDSLHRLAVVADDRGEYAQALRLNERAAAIYEKAFGPQAPQLARSLHNRALVYLHAGQPARAEPLYRRELTISEQVFGPEHLQTSDALHGLANLYADLGEYAQARTLFERALRIQQKVYGAEHPDIARILYNLADLNFRDGRYVDAEQMHLRALRMREKVLGPKHVDTADSLDMLADTLFNTGAYERAEPMFQRALAIREASLGSQHWLTASSLHNLANLYQAKGDYARAEQLYRRALAIKQKTLGPEHPYTALTLNNLAEVYLAREQPARAEPLLLRALAIWQKSSGREHPETAKALSRLGRLYQALGNSARAAHYYRLTLAIYEKNLGAWHPTTAEGLHDLGLLYLSTNAAADSGAASKALPLLQRAQAIRARHIERFMLWGSEARKHTYLQNLSKYIDDEVAVSLRIPNPAAVELGFSAVLQHKGRILDSSAGSVARMRSSVRPEDRSLLEELARVASQWSALAYADRPSGATDAALLSALAERQELLEAQLAQRSREYRRQFTTVSIGSVLAAMPRDAALVELYRFQPQRAAGARVVASRAQGRPASSARGTSREVTGSEVAGSELQDGQLPAARYVAYVLQGNGALAAIDLGAASVIDELVQQLRAAVGDPQRSDVQQRAAALSSKLIQPLWSLMKQHRRWLVSPDGALNLVPFAALLDDQGEPLVQRFEITYLTSGRDLLRFDASSVSRGPAVVMADPDYGRTLAARSRRVSAPLLRSAELERSGLKFRPLAETLLEASSLQQLFEPGAIRVLTRGEASETNLKALRGPAILHVASHGFFLGDQGTFGGIGPGAENPLLRSGLALAGANQRGATPDDGILSALEAARLDLRGTQLVVLSACETAVGEVQNGEGVYGLRRALVLAGAQSQITSLWKVPDQPTRVLMVDLYRRLLQGAGRSAALRAAQREMMTAAGTAHPYYWAAFVAIGNWTALAPVPGSQLRAPPVTTDAIRARALSRR